MMQAGAMILGFSLILAGLSLVGVAAGWWDLPDDLWGAILVLLGVAGKFVGSRVRANPPEDGGGAAPANGKADSKRLNADKTIGAILLMGLAALFDPGCASPEIRQDAAAWARCAGGGALMCIPAAGHQDPATAALDYAGCLARASIGCVGPLVARSNPPSPDEVMRAMDPGCVTDAANRCVSIAREDNARLDRYDSLICVEREIARCWR
jgi:hypothetical protein